MLNPPTPELIEYYGRLFEEQNVTRATEQAITKLFQTFPKNTLIDEVLLKTAALNALFSTNIYAIYTVAEHIKLQNIDNDLVRGSLDVVGRVARVEIKGKPKYNYSFASKYCHFHAPDAYPIYDRYVAQILWDYQQQDRFDTFGWADMRDYPRYRSIFDHFREVYHLTQFSMKEIDRFLWLYGIERSTQVGGGTSWWIASRMTWNGTSAVPATLGARSRVSLWMRKSRSDGIVPLTRSK
jgi:hypothetical protein